MMPTHDPATGELLVDLATGSPTAAGLRYAHEEELAALKARQLNLDEDGWRILNTLGFIGGFRGDANRLSQREADQIIAREKAKGAEANRNAKAELKEIIAGYVAALKPVEAEMAELRKELLKPPRPFTDDEEIRGPKWERLRVLEVSARNKREALEGNKAALKALG
jgi:hypothetical protein